MQRIGILDFSHISNTTGSPLFLIDTDSKQHLPAANQEFLKHIPPEPKFEDINPSDKDWFIKVTSQGELIKQTLITHFPLAFRAR